MKNRLHVFLIVLVPMLTLLSVSSALSSSTDSPNHLNLEVSSLSTEPGKAVIQFPDPNFEAAVRKIIEKPTGDILASDVGRITKLDVSDLGIKDLTGIEHFISLEELDCSMNELTNLSLSQNIALTSLDCSMSWLMALDVSGNSALEVLYCLENRLVMLNLSQNPALKELFCSYNYALMFLDVSQNPALEVLYCSTNRLAALDISNNVALRRLSCDDNQLTMLDVRNNTALEYLACNDNQLTTLNVSQSPILKVLSCQNNFFPNQSAIIDLEESRLDSFTFDPQNAI